MVGLLSVLGGLVALLAVVASSIWFYLNPQPVGEQVFINGHILTMDDDNTVLEAMHLKGDRIVATGKTQAILQQAGKQANIIDLHGQTVTPGFIEAHGHFPGSGLKAVAEDVSSPPVGTVLTIGDVLKRLRQRASEIPPGEWVIGYGFDDSLVAEHRFMTREELDTVSTEHPVFVLHVSAHMAVINSQAQTIAGIDQDTVNPDGGEIVRNASGAFTGLLLETAHDPVRDMAFDFSILKNLTIVQTSVDDYVSQGVTTVQSGKATESFYRPLNLLSRLGVIPQRVIVWPDLDLAKAIDAGKIARHQSDKLSLGALKLTTDGSIQGYTGYLSAPYHQTPSQRAADFRGEPVMRADELSRLVSEWHDKGWQLALHANGDAAIDNVLSAVEAAQNASPRSDARHVIVHAQMSRHDQLEKMQSLGVTPSFFPAHVYYWGDRHNALFLGAERAARISPLKSADEYGVRYSIHLDTPVVPIQPLLLAWSAVQRETSGGEVLGPEERIGVMQALRAITIDAAWQVFQKDNRGSLEAGKYADFVVLSDNPLVNASRLHQLAVEQTWIGGVPVYNSNK
ncbi:amidohydrolase [Kistimonas scapharcae]|uniref:Amidohydrolase n=2 Tax=Kistimonas scapharcae TaxID=1036133 RepID=A0ABP8V865_9GAMM